MLASAILQPLYAKPLSGPGPLGKVMSDDALSIAISSCLGLTGAVGIGTGGPNGGVRKVECNRFRVGGDGYESPMEEDEEDAGGFHGHEAVKETFDVSFTIAFGGLTGEWTAKGLAVSSDDGEDGTDTPLLRGISELERQDANIHTPAAWKSKFLEAQRQLLESQDEVKSLKDRVLEAVL